MRTKLIVGAAAFLMALLAAGTWSEALAQGG